MEPQRPHLLTVYDAAAGRLLRLVEVPDAATLALRELEERDNYARHVHVEVQGHSGRSREEVHSLFERRARERRPVPAR